jgi:hypothetical protein
MHFVNLLSTVFSGSVGEGAEEAVEVADKICGFVVKCK